MAYDGKKTSVQFDDLRVQFDDIYTYIYTHIYIHIYIYTHIYIYVHMEACNFIKTETLAQAFSVTFIKLLRTTFVEHQRMAASENNK